MNFIKLDNITGVVKRTFPHEDHLLLLEIDHNGDIREATPLNPENSNIEIQQFIDEFTQWINVLDSLTKKPINMLILDNPENYLKSMSNLTYNLSKFTSDFEIISQYGNLKLTSGKLSVFITMNPRIMDIGKISILTTSSLNPLTDKIQSNFISSDPKFAKTSICIIFGNPNDPTIMNIKNWLEENFQIKKFKIMEAIELNMMKNIVRSLTEWIEIEVN